VSRATRPQLYPTKPQFSDHVQRRSPIYKQQQSLSLLQHCETTKETTSENDDNNISQHNLETQTKSLKLNRKSEITQTL